jgi:glycosyltransferase involved in cell wall biosynthesis
MPFMSCIVISHNKPHYLPDALNSLLAQSMEDWEAIVIDSGMLYDQGYFDRLPGIDDPRIRLFRSWETEELRQTKTIASWCINECFRKGLVRGEFVTYLCDDDFFYPNAFQAFRDYAHMRKDVRVMYASVDMTSVTPNGEEVYFRESVANEMKGRCCGGGPLDCHVDYLQLCHRVDALKTLPSDEYWPESRESIRHADGLFMEALGERFPIHPVKEKIGQNRKVPSSLNDGGKRLVLLQDVARSGITAPALHSLLEEHDHLTLEYHTLLERYHELLRESQSLRHRLANKVDRTMRRLPGVRAAAKRFIMTGWKAWKWTERQFRTPAAD